MMSKAENDWLSETLLLERRFKKKRNNVIDFFSTLFPLLRLGNWINFIRRRMQLSHFFSSSFLFAFAWSNSRNPFFFIYWHTAMHIHRMLKREAVWMAAVPSQTEVIQRWDFKLSCHGISQFFEFHPPWCVCLCAWDQFNCPCNLKERNIEKR